MIDAWKITIFKRTWYFVYKDRNLTWSGPWKKVGPKDYIKGFKEPPYNP